MNAKRVQVGFSKRSDSPREVIVEFPGGSVRILTGLIDSERRAVVSVGVSADGDRFAGEPTWWAHWGKDDARGGGCRIIQHEHEHVGAGECFICGHSGADCTGKAPKAAA